MMLDQPENLIKTICTYSVLYPLKDLIQSDTQIVILALVDPALLREVWGTSLSII